MACAARGYKLRIIMPASMTEERKAAIAAYGAELVLVPSLEGGRDLARRMADAGEGVLLVSDRLLIHEGLAARVLQQLVVGAKAWQHLQHASKAL